jgi:hypothetical protein
MNKFNKKQIEAIKHLITDIDELENKPRRLFYALEEFAFAFEKDDAVPSIREAQDLMYSHINEGSHYAELFNTLREFKIEEWEHQIKNSPNDISLSEASINSAELFVKKHISRLTDRRF